MYTISWIKSYKIHDYPIECIVSKSCIQPRWFMFMCMSACYPRQQRDGRQRVAVERQRASDVQTVGRHTPEHAEQAGLWLHKHGYADTYHELFRPS